MADFWADDLNPKGVGYLSLRHPEPAKVSLRLALDLGISAIWIACDAVEERAPSLILYDPLWAMLHDAGVPVALHIGSDQNMPHVYMNTGVERILEGNIGNIETTKPKDLPVIHHSIERCLTCMIYDGVLERFPKLKVGIIALGAN